MSEILKKHLERQQDRQSKVKKLVEDPYKGLKPEFSRLKEQLIELALQKFKQAIPEMKRAAIDGFETAEKIK